MNVSGIDYYQLDKKIKDHSEVDFVYANKMYKNNGVKNIIMYDVNENCMIKCHHKIKLFFKNQSLELVLSKKEIYIIMIYCNTKIIPPHFDIKRKIENKCFIL